MRLAIFGLLGGMTLAACSSAAPAPETPPPSVATVPAAPSAPPPPAISRGEELVRDGKAILSPAWRDAHKAPLRTANQAAHVEPTEQQFEAQVDQVQTEELAKVFVAMGKAGGPEVVAFCWSVAEDETQPAARRKNALGVLEIVDTTDAARTRRANLLAVIAPEKRPNVKDAAAVVAMLTKDFKRCYQKALEQKPDLATKGKLTMRVDAEGNVTSSKATGDLPPALAKCVEQVGAAAHYAPPEAGASLVVVPINFVQN